MASTANGGFRQNNFAFTRLLFAVFVITTHSYPLAGLPEHDWLWTLTRGQVFFSWVGVRGIFVISGFLIFRSLVRSSDISDFFWKRILRLFPALAGVLTMTVLLGPFVYKSSTPYLLNKSVLTYIGNNLSLYNMQFGIAGIFEDNPFKSAINGSLWTRPIEFTLYVAISLLFFIKQRRETVTILLAVLYLILAVLSVFYRDQLHQPQFSFFNWFLIELGVYFVAGALLASCGVQNMPAKYVNLSLLLSALAVLLAIWFSVFGHSMVLLLPVLTISFCLRPFAVISNIQDKIGDLSYGLHLYGFPVQQTLVYFFGMDYLSLMAFGLPISSVFAYFSYQLIEKRVVKYKDLNPVTLLRQSWKIANESFVNRSAGLD